MVFPVVPLEPSVSARCRALASVSCSCFVASFGSEALVRVLEKKHPMNG